MRKKPGIRDKLQRKKWNENHAKIIDALGKHNGLTVSEISKMTGLSRHTLYEHCERAADSLRNQGRIIKDGRVYYTVPGFVHERLRQEKETFQKSEKALVISPYVIEAQFAKEKVQTPWELADYDAVREYYVRETAPFYTSPSVIDAKKGRLWGFGTQVKIWNTKLKQVDLDLEVFNAVQNLINVLLRKARIEKLGDTKIVLDIFFDLPEAIGFLVKNEVAQVVQLSRSYDRDQFQVELPEDKVHIWGKIMPLKEFRDACFTPYVIAASEIITDSREKKKKDFKKKIQRLFWKIFSIDRSISEIWSS